MWVAAEDIQDAWIGDNSPSDVDLLNVWIARAERMIRRRIPDLEDRIADTLPNSEGQNDLLETAKDTIVDMVTEVFRNPDGIRQANVTTGPYTESRTYSGDAPGKLVLTDRHLEDLAGVKAGQAAFTVDMTPQSATPLAGPLDYWEGRPW